MAKSAFDLGNWTKGSVTLFQALGFKGATYPDFSPELVGAATVNSPGPASVGQTQNTGGGQNATTGNVKGYHNPIGPGLVPGRVDMGVDYSGAGPLYAVGNGTIVNTVNRGWPGGSFIGLKLTNGLYVYYAENIAPVVRVGQTVRAGDIIGHARGTYPYVEIGWAAPPGTGQTMAAKTGQSNLGQSQGDPGKYPTGYGVSFNNFIKSLGGKSAVVGSNVQGSVPSGLP